MPEENTEAPNELEILKNRARTLGIEFSNNIKTETLRERIAEKLGTLDASSTASANEANDEDFGVDLVEDIQSQIAQAPVAPVSNEVNGFEAAKAVGQGRDSLPAGSVVQPGRAPEIVAEAAPVAEVKPLSLKQENMRLIRVRITNLDPKKKDLHGEIITVANEILGTVKVFVPFGEVTDDGWHIPYVIYKMISKRKFLSIRTIRDRRTGHIRVEQQWAKEFALDVLPPLTPQEISRLATAQAAAGSIE